VLNAIRELDFDNSLGKIPNDEYPRQRDILVRHGAEILKQIDKMTPQEVGKPVPSTKKGDAVETFLAARRNQTRGNRNISSGSRADRLIAQRRKSVTAKANQHCPHCGKPVLGSDLYCPSCGKPL
jgi:rubrerythrin